MITRSMMYWITRLDDINDVMKYVSTTVFVLGLICVLLMFIVTMATIDQGKDVKGEAKVIIIRFLKSFIALTLAWIAILTAKAFVPTTREMAAIVVVPAIASNENLEKAGKVADSLFTLATEWMQELRPENVKAPAKAQN